MTADVPPPPGAPMDGAGGMPASQPAQKLDYATFGQRAGAFLLDIVFLGAAVLVVVLAALLVGAVTGVVSQTLGEVVGALVGMAGYLAILVTLMLMEAGPFGQTPGKHVVGIRVVDTSGRTVSKGLAVGRYFAKVLSQLPCYLGYLWPLWDPEKRTFHDMIVGTRVVKAVDQAPSLTVLVQAPYTGRAA